MTLDDARAAWFKVIQGAGAHCPCCDRWGKINPRGINATMARSLTWLYRAAHSLGGFDAWVDVPRVAPRWVVQTNQLPTLRWWGLVERRKTDNPRVKHSGLWRLTAQGRDAVLLDQTLPAKVFVYNATAIGFSRDTTSLTTAFGVKFSYADVMNESWSEHAGAP